MRHLNVYPYVHLISKYMRNKSTLVTLVPSMMLVDCTLCTVSNSVQKVDMLKRLACQKASERLFPAKEAIPAPQGNLAGLPENKSPSNQENHAEIACQKRCSMKLDWNNMTITSDAAQCCNHHTSKVNM